MPREAELVICLIAVLKLGCAYIPIDNHAPVVRTYSILDDAQPTLIIGEHIQPAGSLPQGANYLDWYDYITSPFAGVDGCNDFPSQADVSSLAYIIYTSGTTGKPKGVAVEHRSFVNIASDISRRMSLTHYDRFLAITTLAFDISTLEIFMPLMFGATVVLTEQKTLLAKNDLPDFIDRYSISLMQGTPSFWHQVSQQYVDTKLPVRALCGGEALPYVVARWLSENTEHAWNVYGPTETTVWSTAVELLPGIDKVTIGRPLANTQCFVLDEQRRLLPPGVIGEMYISGLGVARGYYGNERQTQASFLPNIFVSTPSVWFGPVMYKTGDRVRYLPEGNFEYLSRLDNQIKLRGHRIELGEIESVLRHYPGMQQVIVNLQKGSEDQQAFLVAYYQAQSPVTRQQLQDYLVTRLPDYMLPSAYMYLPKLPLNMNGKVDRNALPAVQPQDKTYYVAPENEIQRCLCQLFQDVLGSESGRVGITDDFFALGGNSLSAIRLVNRINGELQCDLKVKDIFERKTIAKLTSLVAAGRGTFLYQDYQISQCDKTNLYSPFPLNNVQQSYYLGRMKSFDLSEISTHIYNEFIFDYLDHDKLERAYNQLIMRHPTLRTVFEDGEQRFLPEVAHYKIDYYSLRNEDELLALRAKYSHKVYSPDRYPLFDIFLSKYQGKYLLHVSFDAIIIDMTSFKILFSEWIALYNDENLVLPTLNISYRDYQLQYERLRSSNLFKRAQQYWLQKIDDFTLETGLPLASYPSRLDKPIFRRLSTTIPMSNWQKIVDKCQRFNISPTALIIELYSRTLCYWSGQDSFCLNLTLFNRLPLHPQIEQVIGDFTVLSLFHYQRKHGVTMSEQLSAIHRTLLNDIDNNLFDGIDVQRLLKQRQNLPANTVIAPVVLTSVLGMNNKESMFELPLNEEYRGIQYAISQTSQVWLDHKAYENDEGFIAEWDYVEQLFEAKTIKAMHESYCALIQWVAEHNWETMSFQQPELPVEQANAIMRWNTTQSTVSEQTLHGLFLCSLALPQIAERIAVIETEDKRHYTYAKLEHDSNTLGCALLRYTKGEKGHIIGILIEKGYLQTVATIGIMRSGGAYLPLHIEWPWERIRDILQQAECDILLLSARQCHVMANELATLSSEITIMVLDEILVSAQEYLSMEVAWPSVKANDLAYIIFTSGSTGKPKGVAINHQGAVNTIIAVNQRWSIGRDDRILALSDLSFDLSVYDLFGLLAVGGSIVIPSQHETKAPQAWLAALQQYDVTLWNTVPQLAALLVDEVEPRTRKLSQLRLFLLSGDWLPLNLPDRLKAQSPASKIVSLGGATEGSIWSIWYEIDRVHANWKSIPYGVAMPNQQMWILDEWGHTCPFGVTGEIHIGGLGIAQGYWQAEALTRERFIYHSTYGRLYKTGDLGRWSAEGYIEFLGRKDAQIKLNGYRVELEDIENNLNQLPGIRQAIVRLNDGELVAYIVPEAQQPVPIYFANRDAFVLSLPAIRQDLQPLRTIPYPLDETLYRTRKSFRQFTSEMLSIKAISDLYEALPAWLTRQVAQKGTELPSTSLAGLLAVCAGFRLSQRALPKYRYPSASSLYAVQVYLGLPVAIGEYAAGYYYYHPLEQRLYQAEGLEEQSGPYLDLVVHWETIISLYAERAFALAQIEVGHMLALLTGYLQSLGVAYSVNPVDAVSPNDGVLACRIYLGTHTTILPAQIDINFSVMEKQGNTYVTRASKQHYCLEETSILAESSDVYGVLRLSQLLLQIHGTKDAYHYQASGWMMQQFSTLASQRQIGGCILGITPAEDTLCSMAIGYIRPEDESVFDVPAMTISTTHVIRQHLARRLPNYMLPQHVTLIQEVPLSNNGKVDTARLPKSVKHSECLAPRSDDEIRMRRLWAELLDKHEERIGCDQSFFTQGGNSLLAMRLVRKIRLLTGNEIRLEDLYNNNTVQDMAAWVTGQSCGNGREEGVL